MYLLARPILRVPLQLFSSTSSSHRCRRCLLKALSPPAPLTPAHQSELWEVSKLVMKRFGYPSYVIAGPGKPSILEREKQDLAVGEHIAVFMCRDTRGLQFRTCLEL